MNRNIFTLLLGLLFSLPSAQAQWMTQTVSLGEEWNAVSVMVDPVPSSCDVLFAGAAVERVMMWSRSAGGPEFVTDVGEELDRPADWLVWRPASDPQASLNTLGTLIAGRSYLIKMRQPATLQITGRAVLMHPAWLSNAFTLTGLPVAEGVTFLDFFRHTDAIGVDFSDGGEIYKILPDGTEGRIYRPSLVDIVPGRAYWVKTGQVLDYDGALEVRLSDGADFIDFGSTPVPRTVLIRNTTDESRPVSITLLPGEAPPQVDGEDLAKPAEGAVPLSWLRQSPETLGYEAVPFSGLLSTNVGPRQTFELTLLPRMNELESSDPDAVWESLLQVSGSDVLQVIGVSCQQPDNAFSDSVGLWVGDVVVDAVSRAPSRIGVSNVWDTVTPVAVSRPYTFRVLLHVSGDGTVRLMQRACPAWLPPAEEGGEPVPMIFTDTEYAMAFRQDHPEVEMIRVSSAHFPLMDPVTLTGTFGGVEPVGGSVVLPFDDPVNPFVHAYHPQHDNREIRNGVEIPLEAGSESFTVTRQLQFLFQEHDPAGANPRWRISEHGGLFEEAVSGLNKTIYVKGMFKLKKVSDCGTLSYLNL